MSRSAVSSPTRKDKVCIKFFFFNIYLQQISELIFKVLSFHLFSLFVLLSNSVERGVIKKKGFTSI